MHRPKHLYRAFGYDDVTTHDKTRDAVRAVVEYLYDDERRNFESSGEPEGHIFHHVRRLQRALEIE